MTWFADLSPCDYFPIEESSKLLAVGWLEPDHPYPTGSVAVPVFARLKELLADPFEPFVVMGAHACGLCRFEAETHGAANLFVPGDSVIYVCPMLILHYINAHEYQPPAEFCEAVLQCSDIRTMDYKRSLLANGGGVLFQKSE